jgi:hypothetical protein
MAYTAHDTPEVVATVAGHLDLLRRAIVANDTGLRALVLTGGFARGEGAVLDGHPVNDYDLVAVRGVGRVATPYPRLRTQLGSRVGLHVDLARVAAARLRWVAPTIFWYETALRGQVLWGDRTVLARIPVRTPGALAPDEGLRLLSNRAAGLLLGRDADDDEVRLQASKALLAAADVHLLAAGRFAPSQTERWDLLAELRDEPDAPPALAASGPWFEWAFTRKTDPPSAPLRDPQEAWRAAADAIAAALPAAIAKAGLPDLEAHATHDRFAERLVYRRRAGQVLGARRWVRHPSARLRVATLRLLAGDEAALAPFARPGASQPPVAFLERLRRAAVQ